ncbi:MAG: hypothetical protein GF421_10775 [Candidatus Aminicenantes bacterium]|nr:hypothetical protein [Candidatus Aminicenantes bacterium]
MKRGLLSAAVILIVTLSGCQTQKVEPYEWGNLRNLGPNINSKGKDEHVTFTQDGKTMYFASIREEGMGKYDIYVSRLESGQWTPAELLPVPVNTERDEFDVFVTLDEKRLFFASNRDNQGEYWNCDIYLSFKDGDEWGEPQIFNEKFSTPGKPDWGIAIPKDFKTVIFSSGREPAKEKMVQIFQSTRKNSGWTEPKPIPWPVNSGEWEATPYLTPDGQTLYLNSARGDENKRDVDIWKFELVKSKWTSPHLMDGPFQSAQHDYDPCLSPDGSKFYFTSNREGSLGDSDIWVVEKVLK